jgi:hypothetical protein
MIHAPFDLEVQSKAYHSFDTLQLVVMYERPICPCSSGSLVDSFTQFGS